MDDTPPGVLVATLLFLILLSAFFSGSETGLLLDKHPVDIVQIRENTVKTVRIRKPLARNTPAVPEDPVK